MISEVSTLRVLTSDQLGSTGATRLKHLPSSMSCWDNSPYLPPPLPRKPSPVTILGIKQSSINQVQGDCKCFLHIPPSPTPGMASLGLCSAYPDPFRHTVSAFLQ